MSNGVANSGSLAIPGESESGWYLHPTPFVNPILRLSLCWFMLFYSVPTTINISGLSTDSVPFSLFLWKNSLFHRTPQVVNLHNKIIKISLLWIFDQMWYNRHTYWIFHALITKRQNKLYHGLRSLQFIGQTLHDTELLRMTMFYLCMCVYPASA